MDEHATQTSGEPVAGDRGEVTRYLQDRKASLHETDKAVRAFVAERPFAAVGIALATGYLLGRAINAAR